VTTSACCPLCYDGTPCQVKVQIDFTPDCSSSSSSSSGAGSSSSGGVNCVEKTAAYSWNIDDGPEHAWTNTGSGDGEVAMDRTSDAQTLAVNDFGFSLPSGGTVVGLTATYSIEAPGNDTNGVEAGSVQIKTSLTTSDYKGLTGGALWPTSQGEYALGSDTDTWGETWGTAEFNNNGVTVELSAVEQTTLNDDVTAYVYWVKLRVCYVL